MSIKSQLCLRKPTCDQTSIGATVGQKATSLGRSSCKEVPGIASPTKRALVATAGALPSLTPRQCVQCVGFCHLAVLVPNVADLLSIDRPHDQRLVPERTEQSFQLVVRCWRFPEPPRPV